MTTIDQPPVGIAEPRPEERPFPSDQLSQDRKAELLDIVRAWIDPVVHDRVVSHPLFQLWFRKDWLSTVELLSLGMNIARLASRPSNRNFLQNCRKHILSSDEANRTGYLWELWCAAVLEHPKQAVTPTAKSTPGFDLSVAAGDQTVRVSCKALNPSESERKFRANCEIVYTMLGHYLKPGIPPAIVVELADTGERGHDPVQLAQRITNAVNFGLAESRSDEATIYVAPFRQPRDWWPGRASYQLTIVQTHAKNEQVRFRSKVEDALNNLVEQATPLPKATAAAIFMKVPPPVSMSIAIEETRAALSSRGLPISAVFLNRSQLFWPTPNGAPQLGHEYERVDNSNALERLPELLIELPIGIAIGEPARTVTIGSRTLGSSSAYFFSRARRFHHVKARGNSTEVQIDPLSTDEVTYVSYPAGREMHISASAFPNWTLIV